MTVFLSLSRIVVATRNPGKIIEIREILKGLRCQACSITEFDVDFEVEEDGHTYAENAIKKATAAARIAGMRAMGDDSGLEVDALDGAPGLYSARFGGQCSQAEKNALLLQKLRGVVNRSARFRCVIAVVAPDGKTKTVEGVCDGVIGSAPQGTHGFGYDPLFFLPEYGRTMAELDPSVKNVISHRARALAQLRQILPEFLTESR